MMLCLKCGLLHDPVSSSGYRSDAGESFPERCPSCKAAMWVDLQRPEALDMLENHDEFHAGSREGALARWGGWVASSVGVLAIGAGILGGGTYVMLRFLGERLIIPAAMTGMLLIMAAIVLFRSAVSVFRLPLAPERPSRWRMPLALPKPPKLPRGARVELDGDPIVAPLSGRACVAYEIGIREDAEADSPDGSWLLLEHRSAQLRVGERVLPGDSITLDVSEHRTPVALTEDDHERWGRFLRERGYTGHEAVVVYETILEPGQSLCVRVERQRIVLSRSPDRG
jgi:hypothetical protein